jgi:hypothetical protein
MKKFFDEVTLVDIIYATVLLIITGVVFYLYFISF